MKLDDRDIACEQDYTPLSNAELVAAIERYAAIMHTAPLIDFDLERITGPARALLARVAELEATLVSNSELDSGPFNTLGRVIAERNRLTARVAELEAQAAQGWRPLGAPPASTGEYLIGADYIPDVLLAEYHADTDMWYQQLPDGEWQLADWATHWRPLPPAPQEPTP